MSDSKEILLAAAAGQFARYGPKGTRVQDIVKAAGINERMIYHHFGSKDALYAAVMREQRKLFGQAWRPAMEKAATMEPYPGMQLALGGFFDALLARPQLAALLVHEGLGDAPLALPESTTGTLGPLRSLYERGQAGGVFRAEVPFELAYLTAVSCLIAMTIFAPRFNELVRSKLFGAELESDPVRLRDQVVGQLLDGMTG
jgi:AcrR family transcriptional regulator